MTKLFGKYTLAGPDELYSSSVEKIGNVVEFLKNNEFLAYGHGKASECDYLFVHQKGDKDIFAILKIESVINKSEVTQDMRSTKWDFYTANSSKYKKFFLISDARILEKKIPFEQLRKWDGTIPKKKDTNDMSKMMLDFDFLFEKKESSKNLIKQLDELYSNTPEFEIRVIEQIKRPSEIRNAILNLRGSACQICGYPGFKKRTGGLYAETHHMIELNKLAPETLQSWNVLVLCPICHKKMHYGLNESHLLNNSWKIILEGKEYVITSDYKK